MDINVEEIREHLEKENSVKEKLREEANNFEKTTRILVAILNRVHSTPPTEGLTFKQHHFNRPLRLPIVAVLLASAKPLVESCREHTGKIAACVPPYQFWRYASLLSRPSSAFNPSSVNALL